jgi:hypothetical protein
MKIMAVIIGALHMVVALASPFNIYELVFGFALILAGIFWPHHDLL